MSKNPFVVLGINSDASKDDVYYAYRDMRSKYESLRFEPGEVGEEACLKLEEIEAAYDDAIKIIEEREVGGVGEDTRTRFTNENLDAAEKCVKENRIDDAQKYLDDCTTRTARWHYLQSAVFYRKNWAGDALKQLELACNMEPGNKKYADARAAMEKHVKANTTAQGNSFYENGTKAERSYADSTRDYSRQPRGCTVCDVCNGLICADCCCECMGGDLISCC